MNAPRIETELPENLETFNDIRINKILICNRASDFEFSFRSKVCFLFLVG